MKNYKIAVRRIKIMAKQQYTMANSNLDSHETISICRDITQATLEFLQSGIIGGS